MAVAALSKLIGLVIMDGWTQLRISQKPLRSCGFVLLLACLLITIALCANVLELLTKFYPRISNYRGNLVQVYNTCHKLLKQKPFLLNVLENFLHSLFTPLFSPRWPLSFPNVEPCVF